MYKNLLPFTLFSEIQLLICSTIFISVDFQLTSYPHPHLEDLSFGYSFPLHIKKFYYYPFDILASLLYNPYISKIFPSAHSSAPFSTYLAITWKSISEITESNNVGFSTLNTSVLSSNIFFHIIIISTRWIILLFPCAQSPLHFPIYGL